MFRKIYKEANDEIRIDESLIDNIFTKAYTNIVPKQKKLNYKYVYSAAAAIMIIIGCSAAIPKLTDKTVPETINVLPISDNTKPETSANVTKIPDETSDKIFQIESIATEKPPVHTEKTKKTSNKNIIVKASQKPEIPDTSPEEPTETEIVYVTKPAEISPENVPATASVEDLEHTPLTASAYISTDDGAYVQQEITIRSVSDNNTEAININLPDNFFLTEKSEGYYKYSGDNGKSFEIYENKTPETNPVLSFTSNGNEYSVTAENMTTSELENIFENLK